jgi:hypothetical protein
MVRGVTVRFLGGNCGLLGILSTTPEPAWFAAIGMPAQVLDSARYSILAGVRSCPGVTPTIRLNWWESCPCRSPVKFHKDGYTDLRGRFDYASVSTPEQLPVERFAVLALSDERGALIREAAPPQR